LRGRLLLIGTVAVIFTVSWFWWHGMQHWLAIHTGTVGETGPYYGFWSGFGSDLGELSLLLGIYANAALLWRKNTCHFAWWCWRHPHHQLADTPYFLCERHHPDNHMGPREAIEAVTASGG
jgi:hypothetical protein